MALTESEIKDLVRILDARHDAKLASLGLRHEAAGPNVVALLRKIQPGLFAERSRSLPPPATVLPFPARPKPKRRARTTRRETP